MSCGVQRYCRQGVKVDTDPGIANILHTVHSLDVTHITLYGVYIGHMGTQHVWSVLHTHKHLPLPLHEHIGVGKATCSYCNADAAFSNSYVAV